MITIKIDKDKVVYEAIATKEELQLLLSVAQALCENCKESAE